MLMGLMITLAMMLMLMVAAMMLMLMVAMVMMVMVSSHVFLRGPRPAHFSLLSAVAAKRQAR